MKRNILIFFILLFASTECSSYHLIGGELTYQCLGGNNYLIKLDIYRDCYCTGCAYFDDPAYVFVFNSSGSLLQTINLFLPGADTLPVYINNPCLVVPPDVCVERAIYSDIVNLPPLAGGYYLVYQRCCRNSTILNITTPDMVGSTYQAIIPDPALASCNSSPYFNNFPPIALCAGDSLVFDHSATDIDGDSLVYGLCPPYQGADQSNPMPNPALPPPYSFVNFIPPYSATNPLGGAPPLSIDPQTGVLTGVPLDTGQFVVGVCVREYRSGILLSENKRDFQFNVVDCDPLIIAAMPSYILECDDYTVNFQNNSINATFYYWDFGDGVTSTLVTPIHLYPDTGVYTVMLIANPGWTCSDTAYASVNIFPGMTANFNYVTACAGSPVIFTDMSTSTNGSITFWSWNFGDAGTSTVQHPQHIYNTGGNYTVTLIVTNNKGCVKISTQNVQVAPTPQSNFNYGTSCVNSPVIFTDLTTISSGSVVSWSWNFGDGSPADNNQNTQHIYSSPGNYNVTLITIAGNGCSDTITQTITVNQLPTAGFNITNACSSDLTQFFDASTISGGVIVSWNWNFGDGSPNNNNQNPSHVYLTSGIFNTTLLVTTGSGCSDTVTLPVNVYPLPASNFNYTSVCLNNLTQFSDASSVAGGVIVAWDWDFGDGTGSSVVQNPGYTYNSAGFYNVALTVTSNGGCVATVTRQVEVYPLPAANFTNDSPCVNTPMTFTDLTTISSGSISFWSWNFANEAIITQQNPSYIFSDTGLYNVILTVFSDKNCSGTTQQTVYIKPLPLSDAGQDTGLCSGFSVTLGTSGNPNYTYLWSPTAGLNSTVISNPVLTLNNDSGVTLSYNYIVTTTSQDGCSSYDTAVVALYPEINAGIPYQAGQCLANNSFDFTAAGIYGPGASFYWDFGDSVGVATVANPIYTYSDTGDYTVTLTITDNGCVSITQNTVQVFEIPQAYFWLTSGVGCDPFSVEFFASSLDPSVADTQLSYFWNFGDNTYSTEQSPIHVFTPNGAYPVSLTIELGNCSGFPSMTANTTIIVRSTPTAVLISDPQETSIFTPVIEFADSSFYDVVSWKWDFGDGTTGTDANPPPHTYPDTGTFLVTLYVVNPYGCTDTITEFVRINPEFTFYLPNAFTPFNKDGHNDVFIGIGYKYVLEYEMIIFNRWGDDIFKTNDINKAWDGRANDGKDIAQQDVYVYWIKLKDVFEQPHRFVGTVTLIR